MLKILFLWYFNPNVQKIYFIFPYYHPLQIFPKHPFPFFVPKILVADTWKLVGNWIPGVRKNLIANDTARAAILAIARQLLLFTNECSIMYSFCHVLTVFCGRIVCWNACYSNRRGLAKSCSKSYNRLGFY